MLDSTLDRPDTSVTDEHWAVKRRAQSPGPLPRRRLRPASSRFQASAAAPLDSLSTAPVALDEPWPDALHSQWVGRFSVAGFDALPAAVSKGQKVGSVRALGIDWPVLAPAAGVVRAMLADDASVVEYGQALVDFVAG